MATTEPQVPGGGATVSCFTSFLMGTFHSGCTAFRGYGANGYSGVFTGEGALLSRVADTQTRVPSGDGSFAAFGRSCYRDGVTTFVAYWGPGSSSAGVYADEGGLHAIVDTNTTVPGTTSRYTAFPFFSSADGHTAFVGRFASGQGLYLVTEDGLTTIADTSTLAPGTNSVFTSFSTVSLSDERLAFYASAGTCSGVYLYEQGALRKIVDTSDTLDGAQSRYLWFTNTSLSGNHLVFTAAYDYDRRTIYLAEVPEPAALLLLALGSLPVTQRRRIA